MNDWEGGESQRWVGRCPVVSNALGYKYLDYRDLLRRRRKSRVVRLPQILAESLLHWHVAHTFYRKRLGSWRMTFACSGAIIVTATIFDVGKK